MPPPLTNLALWLDGAQTAYSDAGVTVAPAPDGRVAQIAQPAPLSGNWTASGAGRPWKEANALDFHFSNPTLLTQPASAAIPSNNCTVGMAWHHRCGQLTVSPFSCGTSGPIFGVYIGSVIYIATAAGITPLSGVGTVPNPLVVAGHLTAKCTMTITCTAGQYEVRLTVNGVAYTATIATAPPSGSLGTIQLGRWQAGPPGANAAMALSQFVAYSAALDSTNQGLLQTHLLANVPGGPPVTGSLVTLAGDSISAAWIPGFQAGLDGGLANTPRLLNAGVAGAHTSIPGETPAYYTSDILPYYSASRVKNVLVMEGISINDLAIFIGTNGQSAATAAANTLAGYYAYLDRAKADGWIVIACTLSPNLAGATYDAARAIINADIRANWAAHAHYLCDLGAAPGMSTTADAGNASLFYDGTHLTAAGYLIWDSVLLPVLQTAISGGVSMARQLTVSRPYDVNARPPTYLFTLPN